MPDVEAAAKLDRASANPAQTCGLKPVSMELRGARVHNLKGIDLDIPLNQLVVVSGVSGSGKSSLAFDTLFAEGQRRYLESFSLASRRKLDRVERPDADRIAHVPVAIGIRSELARGKRSDAGSTVATVAELLDGIRLVFSRIGQIVCPGCGQFVRAQSATDIVRVITDLPAGTRCQLVFAVHNAANNEADNTSVATWLARGFSRGIWGDASHALSGQTEWPKTGTVWLVVDRLVAGQSKPERILESAESALREGKGRCSLLIDLQSDSPSPSLEKVQSIDGKPWRTSHFRRRLECTTCNREFLPLEPRLFDHRSSGGCLTCRGSGVSSDMSVCPDCHGTRFRAEATAVKVANQSIADLCSRTPNAVLKFVLDLNESLQPEVLHQTERIRADIERRLNAVCDLGLDYLTLDRSIETLSGGEFRRLLLAAVIGSGITGTLVVIDEPSAGLAANELPRLVAALRRVLSMRNSVVAVDHAPFVVLAADHLIELGPGAGPHGGQVVYHGTPEGCASVTGTASRTTDIEASPAQNANKEIAGASVPVLSGILRLTNVCHHNLHDFQVDFPLRQLCVVTGISGSGKTSLLTQVLYPAVCDGLGLPCKVTNRGTCVVTGVDQLADAILIDQSPLTKSSRSNPATWLEVFDEIRQTFATTIDARQRGFTAQQFSFNSSSGGRCRSCLGTGLLKQDMQFLPDVTLACPECGGSRYRPEILEVKYRGRSIADVLAMSVSEATSFFRSQPRLQRRFQMLKQIGLDYLVLGQPSETLSGGEAQRLKLAARLAAPSNGGCLIICDEPTTGLHPTDVGRLVTCFRELIGNGHSIVVADNSPELLAASDTVVELVMR